MNSRVRGLHTMTLFSLFSLFSLRATQGKQGKQGCFCHFAGLRVLDREKTTPPAGEAHGGDGTAESARVLLIPMESELLLIPTGYHSTRPPFVKGVAENANDSGG